MTALAAAVGVLTVLTLVNLFILLGVVRRLRTMAANGPGHDHDKEEDLVTLPTIGTTVGTFAVTTTDGASVTDADLSQGQSVVLLLSARCRPCKKTAAELANSRAELPERLFVLVQTQPDSPEGKAIVDILTGVGTVAAYDSTYEVEEAFGSGGYPTAMRIEDGRIVAASYTYGDVLPGRVPA